MDPAFAVAHPASKLGVILAAVAAAGVLCDRDERRRAVWMVASLLLAAVILVGHIADTDQFRSISDDTRKFAALCVAGGLAIGLLAMLFARRPEAFPLVAVAVLPFRIPVAAAGTTANLLVPLYLVVAAGCAASVLRVAGTYAAGRQADRRVSRRTVAPGDEVPGEMESPAGRAPGRSATSSRPEPDDPLADRPPLFRANALPITLAFFIVLYALQALYSRDFDTALEQIVFFLVPFALLFRLLVDVPWTKRLVAACGAVAVALALVFVGIGFWEYHRRELLWNPKVIAANQFESYFRVNSVFWDPNIFGRFLMLAMLALTSLMLWSRRWRVALGTAAVLAVLWGGLVLTFSQSSFAALLAGLGVLAAVRWDARRTVAAALVGVAAAAIFALAFQSTLKIHLGSNSGLNKVTSGRADLIRGGVELFGKRPLWGYGSGSFGRAYRQERKGNQQEAVSASHTLPVTVAAEQGIVGLAAYLAVLVAGLSTLLGDRAAARAPPALDGASGGSFLAARAALAAMFCALVVHTMGYAAFLEDPFTWVVLAMGLALAPLACLETMRLRRPAALREAAAAPAGLGGPAVEHGSTAE
jgi:putative inorganic carbon (HCO3(-)) transporter